MEKYGKPAVLDPWNLSWDKEFLTSRSFDQVNENEAYIDYLQRIHHNTSPPPNAGGDNDSEDDFVSQDSGEYCDIESSTDAYETDQEYDRTNQINLVETFMKGAEDFDTILPYRDQVEVVASFCEGAKVDDLGGDDQESKADSRLCDVVGRKEANPKAVYERLTPQQLYEILRTEVRS